MLYERENGLFIEYPADPPSTDVLRLQIEEQVRMHVQLVTQSYLLTVGAPDFKKINADCKQNLTELKEIATRNSLFYAHNLDGALNIVKDVESGKAKNKILNASKSTKKYPAINFRVRKMMFTSKVFIYPELLPTCGFSRNTSRRRHIYTAAEDYLIALGVEKFSDSKSHFELAQKIQDWIMPCRTAGQIRSRISYVKSKLSLDHPLKYYFEKGELPQKTRSVKFFDPYNVKAPKDQLDNALPDWAQNMPESLRKKRNTSPEKVQPSGYTSSNYTLILPQIQTFFLVPTIQIPSQSQNNLPYILPKGDLVKDKNSEKIVDNVSCDLSNSSCAAESTALEVVPSNDSDRNSYLEENKKVTSSVSSSDNNLNGNKSNVLILHQEDSEDLTDTFSIKKVSRTLEYIPGMNEEDCGVFIKSEIVDEVDETAEELLALDTEVVEKSDFGHIAIKSEVVDGIIQDSCVINNVIAKNSDCSSNSLTEFKPMEIENKKHLKREINGFNDTSTLSSNHESMADHCSLSHQTNSMEKQNSCFSSKVCNSFEKSKIVVDESSSSVQNNSICKGTRKAIRASKTTPDFKEPSKARQKVFCKKTRLKESLLRKISEKVLCICKEDAQSKSRLAKSDDKKRRDKKIRSKKRRDNNIKNKKRKNKRQGETKNVLNEYNESEDSNPAIEPILYNKDAQTTNCKRVAGGKQKFSKNKSMNNGLQTLSGSNMHKPDDINKSKRRKIGVKKFNMSTLFVKPDDSSKHNIKDKSLEEGPSENAVKEKVNSNSLEENVAVREKIKIKTNKLVVRLNNITNNRWRNQGVYKTRKSNRLKNIAIKKLFPTNPIGQINDSQIQIVNQSNDPDVKSNIDSFVENRTEQNKIPGSVTKRKRIYHRAKKSEKQKRFCFRDLFNQISIQKRKETEKNPELSSKSSIAEVDQHSSSLVQNSCEIVNDCNVSVKSETLDNFTQIVENETCLTNEDFREIPEVHCRSLENKNEDTYKIQNSCQISNDCNDCIISETLDNFTKIVENVTSLPGEISKEISDVPRRSFKNKNEDTNEIQNSFQIPNDCDGLIISETLDNFTKIVENVTSLQGEISTGISDVPCRSSENKNEEDANEIQNSCQISNDCNDLIIPETLDNFIQIVENGTCLTNENFREIPDVNCRCLENKNEDNCETQNTSKILKLLCEKCIVLVKSETLGNFSQLVRDITSLQIENSIGMSDVQCRDLENKNEDLQLSNDKVTKTVECIANTNGVDSGVIVFSEILESTENKNKNTSEIENTTKILKLLCEKCIVLVKSETLGNFSQLVKDITSLQSENSIGMSDVQCRDLENKNEELQLSNAKVTKTVECIANTNGVDSGVIVFSEISESTENKNKNTLEIENTTNILKLLYEKCNVLVKSETLDNFSQLVEDVESLPSENSMGISDVQCRSFGNKNEELQSSNAEVTKTLEFIANTNGVDSGVVLVSEISEEKEKVLDPFSLTNEDERSSGTDYFPVNDNNRTQTAFSKTKSVVENNFEGISTQAITLHHKSNVLILHQEVSEDLSDIFSKKKVSRTLEYIPGMNEVDCGVFIKSEIDDEVDETSEELLTMDTEVVEKSDFGHISIKSEIVEEPENIQDSCAINNVIVDNSDCLSNSLTEFKPVEIGIKKYLKRETNGFNETPTLSSNHEPVTDHCILSNQTKSRKKQNCCFSLKTCNSFEKSKIVDESSSFVQNNSVCKGTRRSARTSKTTPDYKMSSKVHQKTICTKSRKISKNLRFVNDEDAQSGLAKSVNKKKSKKGTQNVFNEYCENKDSKTFEPISVNKDLQTIRCERMADGRGKRKLRSSKNKSMNNGFEKISDSNVHKSGDLKNKSKRPKKGVRKLIESSIFVDNKDPQTTRCKKMADARRKQKRTSSKNKSMKNDFVKISSSNVHKSGDTKNKPKRPKKGVRNFIESTVFVDNKDPQTTRCKRMADGRRKLRSNKNKSMNNGLENISETNGHNPGDLKNKSKRPKKSVTNIIECTLSKKPDVNSREQINQSQINTRNKSNDPNIKSNIGSFVVNPSENNEMPRGVIKKKRPYRKAKKIDKQNRFYFRDLFSQISIRRKKELKKIPEFSSKSLIVDQSNSSVQDSREISNDCNIPAKSETSDNFIQFIKFIPCLTAENFSEIPDVPCTSLDNKIEDICINQNTCQISNDCNVPVISETLDDFITQIVENETCLTNDNFSGHFDVHCRSSENKNEDSCEIQNACQIANDFNVPVISETNFTQIVENETCLTNTNFCESLDVDCRSLENKNEESCEIQNIHQISNDCNVLVTSKSVDNCTQSVEHVTSSPNEYSIGISDVQCRSAENKNKNTREIENTTKILKLLFEQSNVLVKSETLDNFSQLVEDVESLSSENSIGISDVQCRSFVNKNVELLSSNAEVTKSVEFIANTNGVDSGVVLVSEISEEKEEVLDPFSLTNEDERSSGTDYFPVNDDNCVQTAFSKTKSAVETNLKVTRTRKAIAHNDSSVIVKIVSDVNCVRPSCDIMSQPTSRTVNINAKKNSLKNENLKDLTNGMPKKKRKYTRRTKSDRKPVSFSDYFQKFNEQKSVSKS